MLPQAQDQTRGKSPAGGQTRPHTVGYIGGCECRRGGDRMAVWRAVCSSGVISLASRIHSAFTCGNTSTFKIGIKIEF